MSLAESRNSCNQHFDARPDKKRAALDYAAQGRRIAALHSIGERGACTCSKGSVCSNAGKHPRWLRGTLEHGSKNATTDPDLISAWWDIWPDANIGGVLADDEIVIDIDRGRQGFGSFEELQQRYGELPETNTTLTGRGGQQLRFKLPADVAGKIRSDSDKFGLQGVDVKAGGSYVVLPPSVTEGPYEEQISRPPVELPSAWVEALREEQKGHRSQARTGEPRSYALRIGGPILEGTRDDSLASIAGMLHDSTRNLEELTAELLEINAARCEPPLPDSQVEKIARSIYRREPCKQSRRATPETIEALDIVERELWRREWRGMGELSARDLYVALIKAAREHGKVMPGGVRVSISVRSLALAAAVSKRTAYYALKRLKGAGLVRADNAGRSGTESGALVLIAELPRANLHHSPTERGPGPSGANLRAPRLRWSAPVIDRITKSVRIGGEFRTRTEIFRSTVRRLGKGCGAAIDALERAGGSARLEELAELLHKTRTRDLRRRLIARLEEAKVVECSGDIVALTADWLDALNRERESAGEIAAYHRDMQHYAREREAYVNRHRIKPEPVPPKPPAGEIRELEPVEKPSPELVEALRRYLDLNPRKHPDRHPPQDRRYRTSLLASDLWADRASTYSGKPTPEQVEAALIELSREEAA